MAQTWTKVVEDKKARQEASIPKDWLLKDLPAKDIQDVWRFPEQCGLLSAKELEITATPVDLLLVKLADATWSAVEVTTAFSKRAIVAHQIVRVYSLYIVLASHSGFLYRPIA
jgi:amidase